MKVQIYCDGACRGNPGPGGWGVLLRYQDHEKTYYGSEPHTTNNRMELMGAIKGLEALKKPCVVELFTDSQYVRQGMMTWIVNWKKKGWKNSQKQDVKNMDLWQRLDILAAGHKITWYWVKGHSGHPENELVDKLANQAVDDMLRMNVE